MSAMNVLEGITMNEDRYVGLLTKMIGEVSDAMPRLVNSLVQG